MVSGDKSLLVSDVGSSPISSKLGYRTRVMRIVYKPENAKKIASAMKELCISFEFINTAF